MTLYLIFVSKSIEFWYLLFKYLKTLLFKYWNRIRILGPDQASVILASALRYPGQVRVCAALGPVLIKPKGNYSVQGFPFPLLGL